MVRRYRCMRRCPTGVMTGLTVTAGTEVFTNGGADQCTCAGIMTVGAVSLMRRGSDQCIRMTVSTVICAGSGYQAAVIR